MGILNFNLKPRKTGYNINTEIIDLKKLEDIYIKNISNHDFEFNLKENEIRLLVSEINLMVMDYNYFDIDSILKTYHNNTDDFRLFGCKVNLIKN